MTGVSPTDAGKRVDLSIERLYLYAAMADKYDGRVHHTPVRNVTLAMPEPVGVVGIGCPDEFPFLGFISTMAPAIAMGNAVVALPSEPHPLAATDFYQVLDTSDLPGGASVELVISGQLLDGTQFGGTDCITLRPVGPHPGVRGRNLLRQLRHHHAFLRGALRVGVR